MLVHAGAHVDLDVVVLPCRNVRRHRAVPEVGGSSDGEGRGGRLGVGRGIRDPSGAVGYDEQVVVTAGRERGKEGLDGHVVGVARADPVRRGDSFEQEVARIVSGAGADVDRVVPRCFCRACPVVDHLEGGADGLSRTRAGVGSGRRAHVAGRQHYRAAARGARDHERERRGGVAHAEGSRGRDLCSVHRGERARDRRLIGGFAARQYRERVTLGGRRVAAEQRYVQGAVERDGARTSDAARGARRDGREVAAGRVAVHRQAEGGVGRLGQVEDAQHRVGTQIERPVVGDHRVLVVAGRVEIVADQLTLDGHRGVVGDDVILVVDVVSRRQVDGAVVDDVEVDHPGVASTLHALQLAAGGDGLGKSRRALGSRCLH